MGGSGGVVVELGVAAPRFGLSELFEYLALLLLLAFEVQRLLLDLLEYEFLVAEVGQEGGGGVAEGVVLAAAGRVLPLPRALVETLQSLVAAGLAPDRCFHCFSHLPSRLMTAIEGKPLDCALSGGVQCGLRESGGVRAGVGDGEGGVGEDVPELEGEGGGERGGGRGGLHVGGMEASSRIDN